MLESKKLSWLSAGVFFYSLSFPNNIYAEVANESVGIGLIEGMENGFKDISGEIEKEIEKAGSAEKPWLIKPSLSRAVSNLVLRSKDAIGEPVRYQPNTPITLGLTIGYGDYSLGYGVSRQLYDYQIKQRGKTKFSNYHFHYYSKGFDVSAFYHAFKGFYIADPLGLGLIFQTIFNSSDHSSDTLPSMSMIGSGISIQYIFNHLKFQTDALFEQSKKVEGAGGSWIAMVSANQYRVSNSATLIPTDRLSDYSEYSELSGFSIRTLGGLLGYGYQFVWRKNYYVGGMALGGAGLGEQKFINSNTNNSLTGVLRGLVKAGIGYNNGIRFIGILFKYDHTSVPNGDLSVAPATYSMELNGGYRF